MRLATMGFLIVLSLFCAIPVAPAGDQDGATPNKEKLMNPAALTEKAPDVFYARFETTSGAFVIEVSRDWAPLGADRFYNLVRNGYYDNCRFFRVLSGFMAQFGINGDSKLNAVWRQAQIKDDPVMQSNSRVFVSFAKGGSNSRTTQIFINYNDRNSMLDSQGFSPFGRIVGGMEAVDLFYSRYGEGGRGGPDQGRIQKEGNAYLEKSFPMLDYIKSAVVVNK